MLESVSDEDEESETEEPASAVDGYNPDAQDEDFDGQQILPEEVPYEEVPARDEENA